MQAFEVGSFSGPEGLTLNRERAEPVAAGNRIVVRMHAASLNYRDLSVSYGTYPGHLLPAVIPLSDGAGEVVAVGPDVQRLQLGDRVTSVFYPDWNDGPVSDERTLRVPGGSMDGVLAQYVAFAETAVVKIPELLSYAEAATLPSAALTAWNALFEIGQLRAGETVLVLGTGGVSLFAIQFAKLHAATVIVTSSSNDKLQRARALGADHTLNYADTPDWDAQVLELTNGRGADLVIEVGGAGTLERSLRAVRKGGTIALIGRLAGTGSFDPLPLMRRAVRLIGVNVGSRDMFVAMNRAIVAAKLRPVIERSYPFEQAKDAYLHHKGAKQFGKIVISVR